MTTPLHHETGDDHPDRVVPPTAAPSGRRGPRWIWILLLFLLGLAGSWSVRGVRSLRARRAAAEAAAATAGTGTAHPLDAGLATSQGLDGGVEPAPVVATATGAEQLAGLVRLAGQPVAGARVTASGAAEPASSDGAGAFSIRGLRAGRYAVRAVGAGAAAFLESVVVPDPRGQPLIIELRPAPAMAGHVADGEGHAVAGAEVTLSEGLVAPPPRSERTDGAGDFRFDAVLPGRYLVTAASPGYVTVAQTLKMSALAPPPLQLVLARAALLVGAVVDDEEHPVAGARVSLVRDGASLSRLAGAAASATSPLVEPAGELGVVRGPIPFPPLDGPIEGAGATPMGAPVRAQSLGAGAGAGARAGAMALGTDGNGQFRAGGLAAGRVTVVVSHPAFLDGRSAEVVLAPGSEAAVRVVLRRAMVVRGRVRDGAGLPVAGAELWVDGAMAAITDKKGRWELRRPPGPFDVEVRARGRSRSPQHVDPAFRPGVGGEVELTVGGADSRLSGVVVDTRGLPVGGARVSVEGADGSKQLAATDGSGEFTLDSAPAGPITLHVGHGEHLRASLAGVQPGDDVRITLAAGGAVEGEVLDGRGAVAPGSKVVIEDSGGDRHPGAVDRSGHFRIAGCAPGVATLRAEAPGYLPAQASIDLPAADRSGEVVLRDVRVTLAEAGLLTGTISDRWGQAIAGATVEAAGARARSDGAGRFSLSPLPTGPLEVLVTTPQGARQLERSYIERGRAASIDVRVR